MRQLMPERRILAFERSSLVLAATAFMGGFLEDEQLEVRLADIFSESAGPREPLLLMAVDVAVDGGDWGDGRLPEELESTETWSGLLEWLDRGGRLVANLGSLSRGLSLRSQAALRALTAAAEAKSLKVWLTRYANSQEDVPVFDGFDTLPDDCQDANLLAMIGTEVSDAAWDDVQRGRLHRPVSWSLFVPKGASKID
ncbi:unnamed protein product [Symbiodinium sp. CCMP2592]|nr:unnamed protein product [Symbiodinium sp. CCMP2592]